MSIREAAWESLLWTTRVLLYPVHFALRIPARLLLIVTAIVPLVGLVLLGCLFWEEILDCARSLAAGTLLVSAVAFLIVVGLFVVILKVMGQLVLVGLQLIGETIMDALRGNWHPGWEVWPSLADTWDDYVAEVPRTFWRTFGPACLIALVALIVGVLAFAAYPLTKPRMVDRYVVVVGANDGREKKVVKEEVKEHFRTRTVFSLTHLKDAQPKVGDGVCLDRGGA